MKKFILCVVLLLLIAPNAYAVKIEDETGKGVFMNEDAAHTSADPGMMSLTVRKDTAAALAGTDADYQPLITDSSGKLHVNPGTVTVTGTVTASQGTAASLNCTEASASSIKTAVEIMDDWDSSDNCKVMINSRATGTSTPVNAVLLDDDPTTYTSASVDIRQYQRVGFMWEYDETEVGNSVSAAMSIDVSPDNTNWFDVSFYDYAGGATAQTSETLSADGSYICWLNKDVPFGYVKVTVAGTNTDADDTASNTVIMYMDK